MSGGQFDDPGLVDFFTTHRNHPDDLYPSEARFLPELATSAGSVLDVGCAAGGFFDVWRAYNPELSYTGVDVSAALVAEARRRHPDAEFLVGDATAGLPLADGAADVVAALGWLHWEPRWRAALAELWRLAARSLFFDVRLHDGADDFEGEQAIPGGTVPYLCLAWERFAESLRALAPAEVRAYGYQGAPSDTVSGMPETICFATFVLERADAPTTFALELPFTEAE